MRNIILISSVLLFGFFACDKPDCPYADERLCDPVYRDSIGNNPGGGDDTTGADTGVVQGSFVCYNPSVFDSYEAKVLLEDFTGFRCTNCLPAAITADNLQAQWGNRLIVVAYHVFPEFAAPIAEPPAPFSTDLRTPEGEALGIEYMIPSLPNGLVNRRDFGTGFPQSAGSWPDRVEQLMSESPGGFVRFRDVALSDDQSEVSFRIGARMFGEINEDYNLVVGIYENGIIEGQKDGSETIYPYTHDHVFRGNINGTYGQVAFTPSTEIDDNCAMLFDFTAALDPEWIVDELYLFAYLINAETLEVVQSEKHPVNH